MGKVDANFRRRLTVTPGTAQKDKPGCSGWERRRPAKGKVLCACLWWGRAEALRAGTDPRVWGDPKLVQCGALFKKKNTKFKTK